MPGLARPVVIDTATLSQEDAAKLEELVEAAEFFAQPAEPNITPAPGAADFQQYSISVEKGDKRHMLQLTEPLTKAPAMRALVTFLEQKAKELRGSPSKPAR